MNLGTGKDYSDYLCEGKKVPYHLIDIADPGYKYNVFEYQRDIINVLNDLKSRNKFPVVCGDQECILIPLYRVTGWLKCLPIRY